MKSETAASAMASVGGHKEPDMGELEAQPEIPATIGCWGAFLATCLFFAVPLVLGVLVFLVYDWRVTHANRDFERLLRGDATVGVLAMTITRPRDHEQVARVEDPAVLGYLTEMFRKSDAHEGEGGDDYYVDFELSTGRKVHCGICFPSQADQLTILLWDDVWIGADSYAVTLKRPIPEELGKLLARLR